MSCSPMAWQVFWSLWELVPNSIILQGTLKLLLLLLYMHGVWKSQKKSYSTLRASERANHLFWLFSRVNSKPTNQRSSFCLCFCNWEFDGNFIFYVICDTIQVLGVSKLPHFDRFDRHVEQTVGPKGAKNRGKPQVPAWTDYKIWWHTLRIGDIRLWSIDYVRRHWCTMGKTSKGIKTTWLKFWWWVKSLSAA